MKYILVTVLVLTLSWSATADELHQHIEQIYPDIEALYQHLHAHPELSLQEEQTAARLAQEMRALGYEVTTGVGGHGVVAMLRNGDGPTVMLRTDTDALPVTEKTGLPYASQVTAVDRDGNTVGVMHACGHDVHMACWVGAARILAQQRDQWRGTLMFIAQPAEEIGAGARMMLEDGLFERFAKPDYAVAIHVDAMMKAGTIGYRGGYAMANVDSVDVHIVGAGGHGARPHEAIDPVVIAARLVMDLQTLVSREVDPLAAAVVTVGSIHGGTTHNIIPPDVRLQLTVRSFTDEVREKLLAGIRRKAEAAAASAGAPQPTVTVRDYYTPAVYNDPQLTQRLVEALQLADADRVIVEQPPSMGGEDFGRYGRAGVPITLLRVGSVADDDYQAVREGRRPPIGLHSDRYAPAVEPTLQTGMWLLVTSALELLDSPQ